MPKRDETWRSQEEINRLIEFVTAQANVMLAQYNNFNRLLGKTNDHTHTGNLCENLLKECLRSTLPKRFSIDKGYILGRDSVGHCPEIDILIHDEVNHSLVFRMQDIVVVQPKAIRGIIQVKKDIVGELKSGLENVFRVRQLLDNLFLESVAAPPDVFSAVFSMEGRNGKTAFRNALAATITDPNHVPDFIGSLNGTFCIPNRTTSQVYGLDSILGAANVALPTLLTSALALLAPNDWHQYHWPDGIKPIFQFSLSQPE